jgi:hypothetical protein
MPGRSQWPRRLRPFACWDCGFESRRGHGCLSVVSVVCCQVEVSASGWSLVQRSPTECGVSECDREASTMKRPWPTRGCRAIEKKKEFPRYSLQCLYFYPDHHAEVGPAFFKTLTSIPSWFPYSAYKIGRHTYTQGQPSCKQTGIVLHNSLFVCTVQEGRHARMHWGWAVQGGAHHLSGMQCAG